MYCSSCGTAVAPGLSYCNYCGVQLGGARSDSITKSPVVSPGFLVAAMVFVFVFGLGAIGFLMGIMKAVFEMNLGVILAVTMLSFLIMLALEGVFMSLLLGRRHRVEDQGSIGSLRGV